MRKHNFYWLSQVCGWLFYIALIWTVNSLNGEYLGLIFYLKLVVIFALGVCISHVYRWVIIRLNWLTMKIVSLIPRILIASIVCGFAFFLFHTLITDIFIQEVRWFDKPFDSLKSILNLSGNFILWSLIYFLFHFIESYRKEEIKNLKWEAHSREVELNRLKSQMNPHFIFNAMNTIRALVDEDPKQSKEAITQLSNILRSSMFMNKNKVIPLSDELQLVNDYLNIEKARYEERLEVDISFSQDILNFLVPPLIIQTLVENGIKHGIAELPEGGKLKVQGKKSDDNKLFVTIENDGEYLPPKKAKSGFGLINSQQRIKLLYGDEGNLRVKGINGKVQAILEIPQKPKRNIKNLKIRME